MNQYKAFWQFRLFPCPEGNGETSYKMAGWCLLSESPSCVHLQSVIRQENPSQHHYLAVNFQVLERTP